MKKMLTAFLTMVLLLTGCTATPVVIHPDAVSSKAETAENSTAESAAGKNEASTAEETAVRTGLALVTDISGSVDAGEEAGEAKYDVTLVAVTVDDSGVIDSCVIDGISAGVQFDTSGKLTSDPAAEVLSKNELGENYGMKAYGGAKYEWNEQAAALAEYAAGKTLEELRRGAVNEAGKAADADLASVATIRLGGYVDAIEAAVQSAEHYGAHKGDVLKLASISDLADSTAAAADAEGKAQLNCDAAVVTMDGEKITSCVLDSVQAAVAFDHTGKITTDLSAPVQTKNQLGEAYGMKQYAGSKYEWNEQAAAFAEYVRGKTRTEVAGIAVDERQAPADPDLAATVTISVGGFMTLLEKAMA